MHNGRASIKGLVDMSRYLVLLVVLAAFSSTSCTKILNGSKKSSKSRYVYFPPKPDTARFQYLTHISSSYDIEPPQSKFNQFILGAKPGVGFSKLYGIAARKNVLYAVDAGVASIVKIDFENKTFTHFNPVGAGQLQKPLNCYLDSNNSLYVADAARGQIVIYDDELNYVNSFGDPSKNKPIGVWVHDGKIWVPDRKTLKVEVYENKAPYKHLTTWPEVVEGDDGYVKMASQINISDGVVYITDMADRNIQKFTLDGKYIGTVGRLGTQVGTFTRPKGIAVDKEKLLFVVDAAFSNIQLFNDTGQILMDLGRPVETLEVGVGGLWLPACIAVDYENLSYFQQFVDPRYDLKYLVFVTNQYGTEKISVYGRIVLKKKLVEN